MNYKMSSFDLLQIIQEQLIIQFLCEFMEIAIPQRISTFWCHYCQLRFDSELKPGKDNILCPNCKNDFCEIATQSSRPQLFRPFQKPPQKRQKFQKAFDRQYSNLSANELAQIIQLRESQNFEVTEQMLQKKRTTLKSSLECSVCAGPVQGGQPAIVPACQHTFHEECLVDWIKRKNNCPICRRVIIEEAQENSYF